MSHAPDHALRVGVFGGSFDPPHLGHVLATIWALGRGEVDEVWWVPTYQHAFGKALTPFDTRRELCDLATRHLRKVRVSEIEKVLGGTSRTIETLEALGERHPGCSFTLVIGSDLVSQLRTWKRGDELARFPRIVVPRDDHDADARFSIPNVSSSLLRDTLGGGGDAEALQWLDTAVLARILELGAYARVE